MLESSALEILFVIDVVDNTKFSSYTLTDAASQSVLTLSSPTISLVILFTVCNTVLVMLVWRIWYWVNL